MVGVLLSGGGLEVANTHFTEFSVTVITVLLLVLVTSIARLLFHHIEIGFLPESCLVIMLGVLGGLLLFAVGVSENSVLQFNTDLFFILLVPPIIFDAGYHLDKKPFFDNIGTILLYAVIGTVLNNAAIGLCMWGASALFRQEWTVVESLLYGSFISAVDPVAVISIFEEVHVNPTLNILVFGESVLNDAVSIVLYKVFVALLDIDHFTADIPFLAVAKFLYVSIGGVVVGIVVALISAFITKYTHPIPIIEPLIVGNVIITARLFFLCSTISSFISRHLHGFLKYNIGTLALVAYVFCELFAMSGIVAIMVAGIVMSRYTQANISHKSKTTLHVMIKLTASTAETIVFVYLGVSTIFHLFVDDVADKWDGSMIAWAILFILVFRFLFVYVLTYFANLQRLRRVSYRDQFILSYGGLRGAIAFALASTLPEDIDSRDTMITATLVIIWFTVFFQGITIKPILSLLDIKRSRASQDLAERVLPKVNPHIMSAVEIIAGGQSGAFGWKGVWEDIDERLQAIFVRGLFNEEAELLDSLRRIQKGEQTTGDNLPKLLHNPRINPSRFHLKQTSKASPVVIKRRLRTEHPDGSPDAKLASPTRVRTRLNADDDGHHHLPNILSPATKQMFREMVGGTISDMSSAFSDYSSTEEEGGSLVTKEAPRRKSSKQKEKVNEGFEMQEMPTKTLSSSSSDEEEEKHVRIEEDGSTDEGEDDSSSSSSSSS
ncbi:Sodium/hydrogen exchanger 2 [Balamuthia mandrillaris]